MEESGFPIVPGWPPMTQREEARLLLAIACYLTPWAIVGLVWGHIVNRPIEPGGDPGTPLATQGYGCTSAVSGAIVLVLSMGSRVLLRLSWLPDGGTRAFCCGLLAVGSVFLCEHFAFGPIASLSAACAVVSIVPFWNRPYPGTEQQGAQWRMVLIVFACIALGSVCYVTLLAIVSDVLGLIMDH